jgi:hypothetical protein
MINIIPLEMDLGEKFLFILELASVLSPGVHLPFLEVEVPRHAGEAGDAEAHQIF